MTKETRFCSDRRNTFALSICVYFPDSRIGKAHFQIGTFGIYTPVLSPLGMDIIGCPNGWIPTGNILMNAMQYECFNRFRYIQSHQVLDRLADKIHMDTFWNKTRLEITLHLYISIRFRLNRDRVDLDHWVINVCVPYGTIFGNAHNSAVIA